jgi:PPOX class probable F420-dependent enzyme
MLDETLTRLATTGRNIAAVTTLMPDGTPQTTPTWVDSDGEHVLVNTEVHRQKFRNLERDPRVTVTIWDAAQPFVYSELRGELVDTVTGPDARAHIDELSQRYVGHDHANRVTSERVILKIAPRRA